jgi:hypothetical protein
MMQALNDRFAATPDCEHIVCMATDPGLTATGVNIQHQLTTSAVIDIGLVAATVLAAYPFDLHCVVTVRC